MPKLNPNATLALILALVAGVIQVVIVDNVVHVGAPWHEYAVALLVFFASVGIRPLVGASFFGALHVSQAVAHLIAAGLAAVATILTIASLQPDVKAILVGVLTVAAGLGFPSASAVA